MSRYTMAYVCPLGCVQQLQRCIECGSIGLTATPRRCSLKAGSFHTCHLQVVTWAPQNDVLGHPRVKAFLSHCGANSMYEVDALAHPPDTENLPTECPSLECAGVMLQSLYYLLINRFTCGYPVGCVSWCSYHWATLLCRAAEQCSQDCCKGARLRCLLSAAIDLHGYTHAVADGSCVRRHVAVKAETLEV